jgi:hypothetical protein
VGTSGAGTTTGASDWVAPLNTYIPGSMYPLFSCWLISHFARINSTP